MKTLAYMGHRTRRVVAIAALAIAVGLAALAGAGPANADGQGTFTLVLPDLRVTNVDADPIGNGQTRLEFWVKNEGTGTAHPFVHRVHIQGVGIWLVNSGSIGAGATKYYSFTMQTPPAPPMFRSVQVCADATGQSFELDETDNCLTKSVQFDAVIAPAI
jgi:hypothetical protein